jgi:hypothetical protein
VFFLDGDGRQFSLPVGWTDAAEPDAFVTMAAGRSLFRFADLVELWRLIDGLRLNDRKHDYAVNVRKIMSLESSEPRIAFAQLLSLSSYIAVISR